MLTLAKGANLLVMFLLELGVLVAAGVWGFTAGSNWPMRLLLGLGAPVAFAVVWAVFGAGGGANAPIPATGLGRVALEVVWFGGGAVALVAAGRPGVGALLAAVYLVNAVLRLLWNQ
ncbi:YrdB family protein [Streptosporangium sandarakinum]|uniref:YrdB family protein n=1 Tax=Streptosporangium sandarakinum TaxID=1260955 RepID=UPI00343A6267